MSLSLLSRIALWSCVAAVWGESLSLCCACHSSWSCGLAAVRAWSSLGAIMVVVVVVVTVHVVRVYLTDMAAVDLDKTCCLALV